MLTNTMLPTRPPFLTDWHHEIDEETSKSSPCDPERGLIQSGELKVEETSSAVLDRFEPVVFRLLPKLSLKDSMSINSTTGLLSKAHVVSLPSQPQFEKQIRDAANHGFIHPLCCSSGILLPLTLCLTYWLNNSNT